MSLIKIVIVTKFLAVLFLFSHAYLSAWSPIIYLAGFGDGMMALILYMLYRQVCPFAQKR
jgi:hypothetical protein